MNDTVKCPRCGADVELVSYGSGFVAAHCGEIIYNSADSKYGGKEGEVRR
jgi:predicted RNA-binding Zn-ribbon protein involved in translation (DUF1610 family)